MYTRIVETGKRQLIENVREFLKLCSLDVVRIEEGGPRCGERMDLLMVMPKMVSRVWAPQMVRRITISLDEKWFQTFVTNALVSVSDCYV